jgi:hypothetical protein
MSKDGGVTVTQQMFSQHVSAHIDHHRVIIEEYTNGDGIHINYNDSITLLLVKIESHPTHCYIHIRF